MEVYFLENSDSKVMWDYKDDTMETGAVNTAQPLYMIINTSSPYWEMECCHELGHVLSNGLTDIARAFSDDAHNYRIEYLAWQIAKSICKPKFWNEAHAVRCLNSYYCFPEFSKVRKYTEIKEYKGGDKNE